MSHTNIREEIGRRIYEARKAKGLTMKALGELTDDFKQSRITNWEHGLRLPGPEEIKQLAKALDVSPAYLMCLTDEKQSEKTRGLNVLIPLLDHKQACDSKTHIHALRKNPNPESTTLIPVCAKVTSSLGECAFALKVMDDSMEPELRRYDILIIDPDKTPNPGDFVVANVENSEGVIVRRYKQLPASNTTHQFELLALNTLWADVRDNTLIKCVLVGKVCGLYRTIE